MPSLKNLDLVFLAPPRELFACSEHFPFWKEYYETSISLWSSLVAVKIPQPPLFWAKEHYETVEAVTFAYGQRHHLEIQVAREIAKEQGIRHHILDMSLLGQITENALTSDLEIEQKEGEVPNTFVDGRNHLFLSFAAVLAKQRGIKDIVTGVCGDRLLRLPRLSRMSFVKSL